MKKHTKKLLQTLYLTAALIGVTPAHAAHQKTINMGVGLESCTDFAKDYRKSPQAIEMLYFSWAQGYMTATNFALIEAKKAPQDMNAIAVIDQEKFIRGYCNEHPLADYADAVNDLFFDKMPAINDYYESD